MVVDLRDRQVGRRRGIHDELGLDERTPIAAQVAAGADNLRLVDRHRRRRGDFIGNQLQIEADIAAGGGSLVQLHCQNVLAAL
jgi:hypothetical protein